MITPSIVYEIQDAKTNSILAICASMKEAIEHSDKIEKVRVIRTKIFKVRKLYELIRS